jgi:cytoskeletal protein RodZ
MKITATLILVPKRKWPRAKRVKKAREEERKRRVPVLSRVIFVFILFAIQQILIFEVIFFKNKPESFQPLKASQTFQYSKK